MTSFTDLNNFDPISYLEIDITSISKDEIDRLRISLNSKIGEYILLKFLSQIPEAEANKVSALSDGSKILNQLQSLIPNLEQKILEELNNFKKEYQET